MAGKPQKINSIKGVNDVFAPEIHLWHRLEASARRVFGSYSYDEVRVPIIERTELFARAVGAETDVVSKEMYTFEDRADAEGKSESITLRPEGTAGVVRAFVETGLAQTQPTQRLWYVGPMFRRERPQKGRYRQFWQIGAEAFGQTSPRIDAEILVMLRDFLDDAGVKNVVFEISSLGDAACRDPYRVKLQAFLRGISGSLCGDCQRRIESNPMRVLDCKKPPCQEATKDAPLMIDNLCDACRDHFGEVTRSLDLAGVAYELNKRIVRGLDYYQRTAFELIHRGEGALGSQNAVGGGGRYDGLVAGLGGPDVAGIGFGLGIERLVLVLQSQGPVEHPMPLTWLAALGPAAQDEAVKLARALRAKGLRVEIGYDAKENAFSKENERARKRGAKAAIILGGDELAKRVAQVKDLARGTQVEERLDAGAIAAAIARIN